MQVRCPICKTVTRVDGAPPEISCPSCGFLGANPERAASESVPVMAMDEGPTYAPSPLPTMSRAEGAPPVAFNLPGLAPPEAKRAESTALTLGIIALVGGLILFVPALLGILAIVYGNKAKKLGGNGKAGIVLGSLSLFLFTVTMILAFVVYYLVSDVSP